MMEAVQDHRPDVQGVRTLVRCHVVIHAEQIWHMLRLHAQAVPAREPVCPIVRQDAMAVVSMVVGKEWILRISFIRSLNRSL